MEVRVAARWNLQFLARATLYVVQARDGYDGEYAEVFDVYNDGCKLSFAAHWKSTGRFARYKIQLLSDSVIYRRKGLGSEQTRGPQAETQN